MVITNTKWSIIAQVFREAFTEEDSLVSFLLGEIHNDQSKGWNKGCEADPRPFENRVLSQLKDPIAMKSGGLMNSNVKWIDRIGSKSSSKAPNPTRKKKELNSYE